MKRIFRTMARYNEAMNARLYEACAKLTDAQRKEDRAMFFKSIHGTLNHLLWGDRLLLNRMKGQFVDISDIGKDIFEDFTDLRAERVQMDRDIIAWADGLDSDWLEDSFEWTSQIDGKTRITPHWMMAMHLFNHQTHHRGQVTDALSQLGVDYGVTDLPRMDVEIPQ